MGKDSNNLKSELRQFLKDQSSTRSPICLNGVWDNEVRLNDNKTYFFPTLNLKRLLLKNKPKKKNFVIELKDWNFTFNRKN